MERELIRREIRNALNVSDELSRHEHARHSGDISYVLSALRTMLQHLDRELGGEGASDIGITGLARVVRRLARDAAHVSDESRPRFHVLLATLDRIEHGLRFPAKPVPSKPLLGLFPLARAVPQDVHSVVDYAAAASALGGAVFANSPGALVASITLGSAIAASTALSDTHLSPTHVLPVEAHEALDYVIGAAFIAAPFALGYRKKSPITSALHIAAGAMLIATSLVTDYRAQRGLVAALRSRGGPVPTRRLLPKSTVDGVVPADTSAPIIAI